MIRPGPAVLTFGLGLLVTHGFGLSLVPSLLPFIAEETGSGYASLGLAVAAGTAMYSAAALAAGRLIERIDSRWLILGTFALPALTLSLASQAPNAFAVAVATGVLGANAGVSWPATVHVINAAVPDGSRTFVATSVAVGVGVGVIVNGLLVLGSGGAFGWRTAVLIAAAITALPLVAAAVTIPSAIPRPAPRTNGAGGYRAVLSTSAGRVVLFAGLAGGLLGYPLVGFLSATAVDDLGASSGAAAVLWLVMGTSGSVTSVVFGRYGQRVGPIVSLSVGAVLFAAGAALVAVAWNLVALFVGVVLFTAYYYPMWGLAGSITGQQFEPGLAVRGLSLGLIGAALGGTVGNTLGGIWFDATGSFRLPVVLIALGMAALSVLLIRTAASERGRDLAA